MSARSDKEDWYIYYDVSYSKKVVKIYPVTMKRDAHEMN